jgi:hypothetical protein
MFMNDQFIPRGMCFVEGEGEGGAGAAKAPIPDASAELTRRLAAAEGSASVVAQQLANENHQLRVSERKQADEITRLQAELKEAKKLAPAEGAVVLTKEDAATWEALKVLGKPEEIKTKLESVPALEKKIADAERQTIILKAAEAEGYQAEVLAPLVGDSAIEFKIVDKKEVPFIKDGETQVRLSEHIEAKHSVYLPALKPAQKGGHLKQDGPAKTGGQDVYSRIRERQAEKQKTVTESKPLRERMNMV